MGDILGQDQQGNQGGGGQNQNQGGEVPGWLEAIEDDNLKNDATLRRFKEPQALAVSYLDLRRKLGDNPIVKPRDDDPPEKWDKYYKALGRPDAPEGYEFTPIEGVETDDAVLDQYRKVAHEIGLTTPQADRLNQWVADLAKQIQADQENAAKEMATKTETELRKEWGSKYDESVKLATKALKYHGGEGLEQALKDAGLLNHIEVVRFFHKLGMQTSEDLLKGVGDSTSQSTKYTRAQLERMMLDPRYRDPMKRDPAFVAEVTRGFQELYPGQVVVAPTERGEGRATA